MSIVLGALIAVTVLTTVFAVFVAGYNVGLRAKAAVCGSRYIATWQTRANHITVRTIVRCSEPPHRGRHAGLLADAVPYAVDGGGFMAGTGAVSWTDEESLDGPKPLEVPDAFKRAFR